LAIAPTLAAVCVRIAALVLPGRCDYLRREPVACPDWASKTVHLAQLLDSESMPDLSKSQSHGRIGEAAVYAKCWMHGIAAYFTGGLRNNFAGSDLIVETKDQRAKLWVQVKTGAPALKDHIYLTQCCWRRRPNH